MGRNNVSIRHIDMPLVLCYLFFIIIGWLNIYSAVYTDEHSSIFDFSQRYGMQFIWIITAIILACSILFLFNPKIYSVLSPLMYIGVVLLLFAVIFLGKEVNGSKSWFVFGPFGFQPAEVSKICTSLFLAYVMSKYGFKLLRTKDAISVAIILLVPMLIIILQKETGSALVYCGFIFVLYREGLSGWFLIFGLLIIFLFVITLSISPLVAIICLFTIVWLVLGFLQKKLLQYLLQVIPVIVLLSFIPRLLQIEFLHKLATIKIEYWALILIAPLLLYGIIIGVKRKIRQTKVIFLSFICSVALIFSVDFIFNNILKQNKRARIETLLGIEEDLMGVGYNVNQSKIAIGSGGFWGKGFLEGTQTKFNFVPEQSTDFIFCTIGEEWGFIGSTIVVALYMFLIARIINLSEKQKDNFTRLYGYCVASCLFMHVFINIGMTMGLIPVIGIPLPFLSYGGSSLWTFTILLFIFIRLDLERWR
ncbi:MAG: rod shape-determining protein RodA [Bacteroidales bacterium]